MDGFPKSLCGRAGLRKKDENRGPTRAKEPSEKSRPAPCQGCRQPDRLMVKLMVK